MKKIKTHQIVVAAVILIVFLGVVFSHQKGFYYPVFRKDVYDKDHYALTYKGKCDISWTERKEGVPRPEYTKSLKEGETKYANSEYIRVANVAVMNGGKQIGIGFFGLTLVIEPGEKSGNHFTWFYKASNKMKYKPYSSYKFNKILYGE